MTQRLSSTLAAQLGVRKTPNVVVTSANISPFVWWIGGRTVIVVSRKATEQLSERDLRLIIAHEMAHVKRRDHWFRWLEWISLIGFWWNPVVWWAKTQLRISEEMACDHFVLQKTSPEAHQYANSLLNMAELLTSPAIRPPAVATAINSGGNLEKRLKMIIAEKTVNVSSVLRWTVIAIAICIYPLGIVCAQDFEAVERRLGGAVEAGELSLEQANIMMHALRESTMHEHHENHEHEAEHNEMVHEIFRTLQEVGVQRDSMGPTIEIIRKVARDIQEKGNSFKLDKEIAVYLSDELNLNREQIGQVIEIAERLADSNERDEDDREREMDNREREYMHIVERIKAAVDRGELSEEDAERKIIELRKELFHDREHEYEEREMDARKRHLMNMSERIKKALQNGDISYEEAEKKMIELRKQMSDDREHEYEEREMEHHEMEQRKRKFMEIAERIKAAVKEGDLSEDEAKEKLAKLKKEFFGDDD